MDNWRRTAVWIIVPVVVAAAAVGLGVFLFMREAGRAGEATAKFMPASGADTHLRHSKRHEGAMR